MTRSSSAAGAAGRQDADRITEINGQFLESNDSSPSERLKKPIST
jgi:hypothetical protein